MTDQPKNVNVELFIAMNEDGDWVVNSEESEVLTQLGEECGGYQACIIKLTVKMTPPRMSEVDVAVVCRRRPHIPADRRPPPS